MLLVFHGDSGVRAALGANLAADPILLNGRALPLTHRARYLGLYYGPFVPQRGRARAAPLSDASERLVAGVRATRSLQAQLNAQGPALPPSLAMAWWNSLARSSFSYGAEIWGVDCLTADFDKAMKHDMVVEQKQYMQGLVGVKQPPSRLLYHELGQLPLQHYWAGLVFNQWNKMVELSKQRALVHTVFRADLRMALRTNHGWSAKVWAFLTDLGYKHMCDNWDNMSTNE